VCPAAALASTAVTLRALQQQRSARMLALQGRAASMKGTASDADAHGAVGETGQQPASAAEAPTPYVVEGPGVLEVRTRWAAPHQHGSTPATALPARGLQGPTQAGGVRSAAERLSSAARSSAPGESRLPQAAQHAGRSAQHWGARAPGQQARGGAAGDEARVPADYCAILQGLRSLAATQHEAAR
jgi:hypothetical protein